jgi:hypothetical protein
MSYPYSSFYLEAQWSKLRVAEHFDSRRGTLARNWVAEVFAPGGLIDCRVSSLKTGELTSI